MDDYFLSKADTIENGFIILTVVTGILSIGCFLWSIYPEYNSDWTESGMKKSREAGLRFLALFIGSALCLAFLP